MSLFWNPKLVIWKIFRINAATVLVFVIYSTKLKWKTISIPPSLNLKSLHAILRTYSFKFLILRKLNCRFCIQRDIYIFKIKYIIGKSYKYWSIQIHIQREKYNLVKYLKSEKFLLKVFIVNTYCLFKIAENYSLCTNKIIILLSNVFQT